MFGQTHLLVTQQGTTPFPSIRTLTDDFTTQDTTKWSGWATGVAATNGQLSITPTGATPGVTTIGMFDARSAITSVELIQPPNQGNGSISAWLVLLPANNGAGLRIGEEGGTLYAQWRAPGAGSWTTYASTTFNATAHKIWRLRESGGTLYYETSSNGISWSVLYGPVATPVDLSAVQVNLQSGFWGTEPTPGTTLFDNVNATYADPPPAPRTFYVDPAGVDTADGLSTTTAWKTIAKLNATSMYPGDAVLFKAGGTWAEALTVSGSGTAAAPITYGSYGTGAQPIINGGGASGTAGVRKPIEIYGSFITVQDIEARGSVGNDILINGPDCIVQRCTVRWGAYGITQGNLGARAQILSNTIVNVNYLITGTGNNDDTGAMGVLLSGDSAVVAYNTISGCWSNSPDYGIDGSAIDVYQGTNAQIYANKASECVTFLELGDVATANILAHHNTFTSTLTVAAGLTVHGAAPFGPVAGTQFHHNTVVLTGGTAQCTGVWMDAGTTMDVQNNILVATGSGKTIYAEAAITEAGNVLFGGSYTLTGQTLDATSIVADPHFAANYTDLHLYTDSPAVDRGIDLGYQSDFDGVTPQGAGMDSGAYEATLTPAVAVTVAATLAGSGAFTATTGTSLTATAGLTGSGTVTAAGSTTLTVSTSLAGSGALTAAATSAATRAPSLSGAGQLTAAGTPAGTTSAALAGSGALTATAVGALTATALLTGSGTATATGATTLAQAAAATGSGTLTATSSRTLTAAASLAGSGTLTAAGTPSIAQSPTLTGSGTLTAPSASTTLTATALLAGSGVLAATTTGVGTAGVNLTGSGVLSATGQPATTVTAALTAAGSLTATAVSSLSTAAAATGAGTLTATGTPAATVVAALAGAGTLTATTTSSGATSVALSGSGTLTASATSSVQTVANVALSGAGTLTATTATALNAAANLAALGTLTAITAAAQTVTTQSTGAGALTATTTAVEALSVLLSGTGTLTVVTIGGGRDITLMVGTPAARTLRAGPIRA